VTVVEDSRGADDVQAGGAGNPQQAVRVAPEADGRGRQE